MTGRSLKWLCAILNSTLVTWMIQRTARTTGVGLTQWQKFVVQTIPVPSVSIEQKRPVVDLIAEILRVKETRPRADTSEFENQLNRLVYMLYDLTPEEIENVAASTRCS